jgi:hypothetical protein
MYSYSRSGLAESRRNGPTRQSPQAKPTAGQQARVVVVSGEECDATPAMSWESTFEAAIRRIADPGADGTTRKLALDALERMAWQLPESRAAVFEAMRGFWRQGLLETQRDGRTWLILRLLERRDWAEVDAVVGDDPGSQVILDNHLLQLVRAGDTLDGAADLLGRVLPERTMMALWRAKREPERIVDYLMGLADHEPPARGLREDAPVVADVIALLVARTEERDPARARKALAILADLGQMTKTATKHIDIRAAAPSARRLRADPALADHALAVLAEVDPDAAVVTVAELASALSPFASSWLADHLITGISRIQDGSRRPPAVGPEVRAALREVVGRHPDRGVRRRATTILGVVAERAHDPDDIAALCGQLSDRECAVEALASLCCIAGAGGDISVAEQPVSRWLAAAPHDDEGGIFAGLALAEIARRRREPLPAMPRAWLWACTRDESFGDHASEVLAAIAAYDPETAAWAEANRRRAEQQT